MDKLVKEVQMFLDCLKKRNVINEILNDTNIEYFGLCHTLIRESGLINEYRDGDIKHKNEKI